MTNRHVLWGLMLLAGAIAQSAWGQRPTSSERDTRPALLLVGHGGPATDFPKLGEYFRLHGKNSEEAHKIEEEMARWPRTEENDAYWAGFMQVVRAVEATQAFASVQIAFNEMCAPTVEEGLEELARRNPKTIVVTSIMITPGGVHSEKDIPLSISNFREKHPEIEVVYAWPYDPRMISSFLIDHVKKFARAEE